jgi:type VI secretion system protein ImpJ
LAKVTGRTVSIMPKGEVHWHEGMFLRQHHFLTEHRQLLHLMQLDEKWSVHHNWGLRSIHLNTDALGSFRFSIISLKARLRDGTLVEVPEDGSLAELDLKPALEGARKVMIYLGVPLLKSSQPNIAADGPSDSARYYLVTQPLDDENLGVNPQPVTIRRMNLKLLASTQDVSGYEAIPLARVEKSDRAEAVPQLDLSYIPPLVACDAWQPLAVDVLQHIYNRIGRKIEKLAAAAVSRGIGLESLDALSQKGVLSFAQLRVFNEAQAYFSNLAFLEGIHPLWAYLELCRLVGQLSIFHATRQPPALPRYNHDDLGGCFHRVRNYLDELIDIAPEPDYEARDFVGRGLRMQVEIDPAWLDRTVPMFLGVTSPLEPDLCAKELERLGTKVGSAGRVEMIYRRRDVGLQFSPVPAASLPQALPRDAGPSRYLTYFQINRELQPAEWQAVESEKTLAIRFKEDNVVGKMEDAQEVTLRLASDMTFRFTLYVLVRAVPPGARPAARRP